MSNNTQQTANINQQLTNNATQKSPYNKQQTTTNIQPSTKNEHCNIQRHNRPSASVATSDRTETQLGTRCINKITAKQQHHHQEAEHLPTKPRRVFRQQETETRRYEPHLNQENDRKSDGWDSQRRLAGSI